MVDLTQTLTKGLMPDLTQTMMMLPSISLAQTTTVGQTVDLMQTITMLPSVSLAQTMTVRPTVDLTQAMMMGLTVSPTPSMTSARPSSTEWALSHHSCRVPTRGLRAQLDQCHPTHVHNLCTNSRPA
jgi:hypothetical protein